MQRLRLLASGRVQGVGFRPALYRLARALGLCGEIANTGAGVAAELEGPAPQLRALLAGLPGALPPQARLEQLQQQWLAPRGLTGLCIRASADAEAAGARIGPDLASCDRCRAEVLDPADRRHGYPFTNCTACGPRFTITRALPYDRARTTMDPFPLCAPCAAEYGDPADRRYHAEPTACQACGPRLALCDAAGAPLPGEPLRVAARLLGQGRILAVKGLGGYHLAVDARDPVAVRRLRARKGRPHKPLAVMVRDLQEAARHAALDREREALLASAPAPIVLLPWRREGGLAPEVAPGSPELGLMLAYTPLHLLLCQAVPALVMTSGNRSEEPIAVDDAAAREALGQVADAFLSHDREILVPCEDSVVTSAAGGPLFLRRSRGYAPDPLPLPRDAGQALAVGGQLKSVFCLTRGRQAFLGPHLGDQDALPAQEAFARTLAHLQRLLRLQPEAVACDLHPDYATTRLAQQSGLPLTRVQHHHAHAAAVLAEAGSCEPALALTLDGAGHGGDGTIWGGELLWLPDPGEFLRLGHLRPFSLPGGEACVRRPARGALALISELLGEERAARALPHLDLAEAEARAVGALLRQGVRCLRTTSAGRLFDAVAALCGVGRDPTYEGQPAVQLMHLAAAAGGGAPLPFQLQEASPLVVDPAPALAALLDGHDRGGDRGALAAGFHAGLARALCEACALAAERTGARSVALGGGCLQSPLLAGLLVDGLAARGLRPLLPRRVPPGDGGLALGQALVHACRRRAPGG